MKIVEVLDDNGEVIQELDEEDISSCGGWKIVVSTKVIQDTVEPFAKAKD